MQLFHLGYPKSGSTTIQDILSTDPKLNYLGKPFKDLTAEYLVRELLPFCDLRQLPPAELDEMRGVLCAGQPIISDEILSGVGFVHGIASNSLLQIVDNIDILTGGDFVAHVVIRQPSSFIRSYYGQMIKTGARMTLDQFCALVLLRRHQWVFRALNYRTILNSDHYRSGRLRLVLFERLFKDGGIGAFMRDAFGATEGHHVDTHRNRSDTDSVIDFLAQASPRRSSLRLEKSVTHPSMDEFKWIDRLPEAERDAQNAVWAKERAEAFHVARESAELLTAAREQLGRHAGKRPDSPMFNRLLQAIYAVNTGAAAAFPDLGFEEYRYFG